MSPSGPRRRIRDFFERSIGEDVDRELEFHLEMRARELSEEGWESADARLEASRRFGDYQSIQDECRQIERRHRRARERADMFDALRQDLRFSWRQLLRQPTFTLLALLTMTLGIGATSAIFSLVDGVVLRPLPYDHPERIVDLHELDERGSANRVANPNFQDWQRNAKSFEALAAYSDGATTVTTADQAVNATPVQVSRDFFRVFGVQPRLGRTFLPEETRVGGDPAVVVGEAFYRRYLDPERPLDEQNVSALGLSFRVVGVMPAGFAFPETADMWIPLELWEDISTRTAHNNSVVGRLAANTSLAQARAEMTALAGRLQEEYRGRNDAFDARILPLKDAMVGDSRRPLLMLLGAAALVLLVSATNLASSLLSRALGRRHELAVRGALGAGRDRVVRQLLTETVVLTTVGGLLGLGLAEAAIRMVKALEPGRIPRLAEVSVDLRVLLFTLLVSLATGLVFGLVPAMFASRSNLQSVLSAGGRGGDDARARGRLWNLLVGAEVALALVLLVGSGLLLRTLWQLLDVDPGFRIDRMLTLDLTTPGIETPTDYDVETLQALEPKVEGVNERLLTDLAAVPGVESVGLISSAPLAPGPNGTFCLGDTPCYDDERLIGENGERWGTANYRVVSEGYFRTLDIPLVRGRQFEPADSPDSGHVVIVNEALARRYWPDRDPLGQVIRIIGLDLHSDQTLQVVGVVADVHQAALDEEPRRELYVPMRQRPWRSAWPTVMIATATDEASVLGPLREVVRRQYPEVPPEIRTMSSRRLASVGEARFSAAVLVAFAVLALVLAATSIWSVASYKVAQRTRELGIRLALGAEPAGVVRMVVAEMLRVVGIGALAGALAAAGLTRLLQSQLFDVRSHDPATFTVTIAVLVVSGLLACLLPARRVARIDPVIALSERA